MQISEHRRKAFGVPDLLLYASLIDDGVLLLNNGSLMATWSFRGPDMASATHEEMDAISRHMNNLLKLGTSWMIHCDAIRSNAPGYPEMGEFPDPVTALIDEERRAQFMHEGSHLASEYFLTLTYMPPLENEEKVKGFLFTSPDRKKTAVAAQVLSYFNEKVKSFESMFQTVMRARRLRVVIEHDELGNELLFDDLLRYVRRCVQGEDYKFAMPDFPIFLHDTIGGVELITGVEPKLGTRHMGVIAIDSFPSHSSPGHLTVLDTLPFEYRWNSRARLLDAEESKPILEKIGKKWAGMVRGFVAQLTGKTSGPVNEYALLMSDESRTAISVAAAGDVQFVNYTSNVIVLHEDKEVLERHVLEVVKAMKRAGFGARIESLNAVEAWRGTLPGDGDANPRRFLVHTLNLSDSLPIAGIWVGEKVNPSAMMPRNTPPLLMASSTGSTPFGLNLHVQDLGHTLVLGPPGSGKSTLMGLIAAQWFRYPNARVVCFDKGQSMYVLNQAAGGKFYELGGETDAINFCPLADLSTSADCSWAAGYIEDLVSMNGLVITPSIRNSINEAILRMSKGPESRSLYDFTATVQDNGVRNALKDFTSLGSNGALLDASEDTLRDSRFTVFEMDTLMGAGDGNSRGLVAVLLYLFRQIEKKLDGSPTLIVLDEAWVFLKHPQFCNKIREWLKVFRKMNAVLMMGTQSLSDVVNSDISDVIIEACPTKILLANVEAKNDSSRKFYEMIGLNEREIVGVASMTPKLDYYVTSSVGKRMFRLGLGGVAMAFVGVSSVELRRKAQAMKASVGEHWVVEWLRYRATSTRDKTLGLWAEHFNKQQNANQEKGA
jgi:type IV secretion system protein VirB4